MDKNAFALRPPMGWNSYDYYDTNVTEAEVLQNAAFLAQHLKPYGWEYVVVDIQWYAYDTASMREKYQYIPFGRNEMDEFGRLLPCPEKFPSSAGGAGFKPLADKIHDLGLKFGIHIMRGIPRLAAHQHLPIFGCDARANEIADPSSVCPWNPDMYGIRDCEAGQAYYDSIFALYAAWGVDFIKCDDICATGFGERQYDRKHEVECLHKAIEKCGRPIVLSLSPGPAAVEESWHYAKYANMWRITDDFWDHWDSLLDMFRRCEKWQDHVRPGCWPDCDMLPLGRIGREFGQERSTNFTLDEQKTMLSLWCMFHSPLMLGAELTKLDEQTLQLLQKEELLHLHSGSFTSRQIRRDPEECVWAAVDPATGAHYIALFNLTGQPRAIALAPEELTETFPGFLPKQGTYREVWSEEPLQLDLTGIPVAPHGTVLLHMK